MTDESRIITRPLLTTAALLFATMLALSVWAYVRLPADAQVPMHWNFMGEVDRYAGRFAGLFAGVALFPLVVGLLLLVPRIEPRRINLARSARAYRATTYAAMAFLTGVHAAVVATALGRDVDVNRLVLLGAGLMVTVIGNWLPKVRSTYLFGIRTPWTLSSDAAWRRTHRVGGWAFVVLGLATVVAAVTLSSAVAMGTLLVGLMVLLVGLFAYSYAVWRSAPDRRVRNGVA